jgi:hypothetical protein
VTAEAIASAGSGGSPSGGPFDYALFAAGSQDLTINQGVYKGSIYSGGSINFNGGGIKVDGNMVAKKNISGYNQNNNSVTGTITQNSTQTFTMPDYSTAITNLAASSNQTYSGDKNLAGNFTGDIYVKNGSLTIGTNSTTLTGTVIIMADNNITINSGNVTMSGSSQVIVYSRTGNITFQGGGGNWAAGTVVAYAPGLNGTNGIVDPGGGSTKFCSIVAQQIKMGGGSLSVDRNNNQVQWPSTPAHVQLIH